MSYNKQLINRIKLNFKKKLTGGRNDVKVLLDNSINEAVLDK